MKIAIIGQGYVGLTISAFAGERFDVVGFDNNKRIVDQLNRRRGKFCLKKLDRCGKVSSNY
jgi:UDP-N-acetyl-D-mannosaminuronate dehydrogenase